MDRQWTFSLLTPLSSSGFIPRRVSFFQPNSAPKKAGIVTEVALQKLDNVYRKGIKSL